MELKIRSGVVLFSIFYFLFSAKQARLLLLRASESTARLRVPTVPRLLYIHSFLFSLLLFVVCCLLID